MGSIPMSGSILLDVIFAIVVLIGFFRGLRHGFFSWIFSAVGLALGTAAGIFFGPHILDVLPALTEVRLMGTVSLLIFIGACAWIGTHLLRALAVAIRGTPQATGLDAFFGGILSVLVSAGLIWSVLTVIRPISPPALAEAIDKSYAYQGIQKVLPDQVETLPNAAIQALVHYLPDVFDGTEPHLPISPPDQDALGNAGIERAGQSVMKIVTSAPSCSSDMAGSGWVVAAERVVTNAHVVAASMQVRVQPQGVGESYDAMVVAFDPTLDLAILYVPGLPSPALERESGIEQGDDAIAAGFPWAGSYKTTATRVRGQLEASGSDIYGQPGSIREIYALRGHIYPGNSGGPLLNEEGKVVGTVFARSASDDETGYALTDGATAALLDSAGELTTPVTTGACVSQ